MIFWKEPYKEIADRIERNLPEIQFIDLWHEQISYLSEELEFPSPAVFIDFNVVSADDLGEHIQKGDIQIDMRLFYETFSDTYNGSVTQDTALEFLESLTKLHALFHGKSGDTYSEMRRISMSREDSGGVGNLYRISFQCNIIDESAKVLFTDGEFSGIKIKPDHIPVKEKDKDSLYFIQ